MKIRKAIIATSIFFIILIFFYIIHIKYFSVNVLFYSAILDAFLATIVTSFLIFKYRFFHTFNIFERIQISIIWFLIGYALAISLPTVIDRSLSFYILEKIEQRGGGIKLSYFEDIFTKEYIYEHRLVDVRLTEQKNSGTISVNNGCVKITGRGRAIVSFSRFFRLNLLPKKRLLMGEYTDDLTDPFRNSKKITEYKCK